jgi:hypothetical protein
LRITQGGTPQAPLVYSGNGQTAVGGIEIKADNVVVQGFKMDKAPAPAIEATGKNITIQDNTVTAPSGGDGDAIRMYGDHIKILHNSLDTTASDSGGHNDCMQTFTSSGGPATNDLLVDSNVCHAKHQGIMAEAPADKGDGGGGTNPYPGGEEGHDVKWTITNNIFESTQTSQNIMLQYVDDATITGNQFGGSGVDHAIGLTDCKNYKINGNKVPSGVQEVNPNDT